jgi:uncharacterized protein YndB with AHSA1/START domain
MSQRGYAQFVEIRTDPARAWSAITEEHWLKRWYALDAAVEPHRGGRFRVRTRDKREREATIDVWDPGRRLRLIYHPEPEMLDLHGEGVGPVVEDLLIDAKTDRVVVRVFGSGVPDAREWDRHYSRLRLSWAYALHELKRVLEAAPAQAVS